eukprot:Gregarina_sp_Poly_1__1698@NODE_1436_length_4151_cov_492_672625_g952_i0_p1_GENE_NODE_1436_length_4151_cov_492_672625_g952_i0NODE_1436_length_4151_cov_492_672625_g952_i0_p1_ORF_typecomplete_len555_score72_71Malic_M/PF03949_15/2_7e74malic/PF00390_19/6_1e73malic/PF00390_19/4_7e03_NODE_1436_length_4151_cov_492_672625_g952_i023243988
MPSQLEGVALLRDPLFNKGTAFNELERNKFKLHGLLPPHIGTLEEQIARRWECIQKFDNPLNKYMFLRELQDSSETLFLALVCKYIEELMPIVYTPTVGEGCLKFSHLYRRPRGLSLSFPLMQRIPELLQEHSFDDVEVIVVTDGERILGLGDLGAGGMGIPIGKLALYAAGGGFHPRACLPMLLDVGTDNTELLNDSLYIGWKHPRVRGAQYDLMIDQFVKAVKGRWPNVLLQWEDFHKNNANRILQKYRTEICSFNDDIQGTAVVAAGALTAAAKLAAGGKLCSLRYCFLGAGSAACGIADLLHSLMRKEADYDPNTRYFVLLNSKGLLTTESANIQDFQKAYQAPKRLYENWVVQNPNEITLMDVVQNFKPTALIGVSAVANAFTEEIVRFMASYCDHPVIFPLSNPIMKAEAHPQDLMRWTNYKALISTGSPFGLIDIDENGTRGAVAQANNVYVFPGIGLGVTAVHAKMVTDEMLESAALALAAVAPAIVNGSGPLLPPLSDLRSVSKQIGAAVARKARDQGLCPKLTDEEITQVINNKFWEPKYEEYA